MQPKIVAKYRLFDEVSELLLEAVQQKPGMGLALVIGLLPALVASFAHHRSAG